MVLVAACSGSRRDPTGPATGGLAVTVSGLPAGAQARVEVSGPGGYQASLTSSGSLSDLPVGAYTVAALDVVTATNLYAGVALPASVNVIAGDVAPVAVTYTGGPLPTLNLQMAGVMVVQSVQRSDNSVPLVSGRDAVIRVFGQANQTNSVQPAVRVRLYQGNTLLDSITIPAPGSGVPTTLDTATVSATWNGLIPGALVVPGLAVEAEIDPDNLVSEVSETDNRFPGGGVRLGYTVVTVPQLDVRFVPVKQSINNLTGNVSNANRDALMALTLKLMPLGAVTADLRATYTTDAPQLASNDSNNAWGTILSEISALRTADGSSRGYVGVVPVTYGSGIAGLGYIGFPAALSWDKATSAPGIVAHELGHNFGRQHAPCGNPGGVDGSYPYANASIGVYGFDVSVMQVKSPSQYVDLMSYCDPDWISDYNYLAVMNYRGTSPVVSVSAAAPGLLVWGRVGEDGALVLEPAFRVDAPPTLPNRTGPFRLVGTSGTGGQLFSVSFAGELVPDLPRGPERHFAFVLPLDDAAMASLASIRLEAYGLATVVTPPASLTARGAAPPTAPTARPAGGGLLDVSWDGRYPMAVVRDAQTNEILSFARRGRTVVQPPSGRVRLELSSGVGSRSTLPVP